MPVPKPAFLIHTWPSPVFGEREREVIGSQGEGGGGGNPNRSYKRGIPDNVYSHQKGKVHFYMNIIITEHHFQ